MIWCAACTIEVVHQADLLSTTEQFALASLAFYRGLSKSPEAQVPGIQFYKSATSTWANYRSSKRGRSRPQFLAKLGVAVEECDEAQGWLEFMQKGDIASDATLLADATVRNSYCIPEHSACELGS